MTFTWRTTGAWGTGKGTNLVEAEFDQNFYDAQLALAVATSNKSTPIGISKVMWDNYFGKVGFFGSSDNLLGFFYYPPVDTYHRYGYLAKYLYGENNLLMTGVHMYLVLREHISDDVFDPNKEDTDGPYFFRVWGDEYNLDIPIYFPGNPGFGVRVTAPIGVYVFTSPGTLTGGIVNARIISGELEAAISLNSTPIGTVHLGGTVGEIVDISSTQVEIGDQLSIAHFDDKTQAEDISLTFMVVRDE
jgi:hypothetical protein